CPHTALRCADCFEFCSGSPTRESFQRCRKTFTWTGLAACLQCYAGKRGSAQTKVVGRFGCIMQDGQHVMCLERRPNAAAHGLASIGEYTPRRESEPRRDGPQALLEVACALFATHLGRLANWNIDDHVGRSRGNLFRENRRDEL